MVTWLIPVRGAVGGQNVDSGPRGRQDLVDIALSALPGVPLPRCDACLLE